MECEEPGGRLSVRPVITGEKRGRPDGHYVAEGTLLPLVPLLRAQSQPDKTKKPRESLLRASSVDMLSSYGCAGAIPWLDNKVKVPISVELRV
jgi:hypothetical protein